MERSDRERVGVEGERESDSGTQKNEAARVGDVMYTAVRGGGAGL